MAAALSHQISFKLWTCKTTDPSPLLSRLHLPSRASALIPIEQRCNRKPLSPSSESFSFTATSPTSKKSQNLILLIKGAAVPCATFPKPHLLSHQEREKNSGHPQWVSFLFVQWCNWHLPPAYEGSRQKPLFPFTSSEYSISALCTLCLGLAVKHSASTSWDLGNPLVFNISFLIHFNFLIVLPPFICCFNLSGYHLVTNMRLYDLRDVDLW